MIEERLLAAKQYVKTLFADRADGHDVAHALRVYTNAMRIAQAEGPCDLEIVDLSSLRLVFLKTKSSRFVGLSMLFLSAKIVVNIQKP